MTLPASVPLRILLGLMIFVVVLIVTAVGVGLALPRQATVTRSIVIDRPPSTVFTVLNGFRHFEKWSPWAELDPAMKVSVEGPITGVGARYVWTSEIDSVGSGSQEILESIPYEQIVLRLEFGGMDVDSKARFNLSPEDQGTRVAWRYEADFGMDLFGRYFGLMLDGMIGPDYEKGLARLKAHVESLPGADFAELGVERLDVKALPIAYVRGRSGTGAQDIARAYADAFQRVTVALNTAGIKPSGSALAIGRRWDESKDVYEFDAAIPVPAGTPTETAKRLAESGVKLGNTHAGTVLKAVYRGAHKQMSEHLEKLMAYQRAVGLIDNGAPWDVYVSDPETTLEAELVTETYVPVR